MSKIEELLREYDAANEAVRGGGSRQEVERAMRAHSSIINEFQRLEKLPEQKFGPLTDAGIGWNLCLDAITRLRSGAGEGGVK